MDDDAFSGKTLPKGTLTEDPRTATATLGEAHLVAAVEAAVALLGDRLASSA